VKEMRDLLNLIKKFSMDLLVRFAVILVGILWVLSILYFLGFVATAHAGSSFDNSDCLYSCITPPDQVEWEAREKIRIKAYYEEEDRERARISEDRAKAKKVSSYKENIKQSIYETAEQLMTCSSAIRNTWSVYDTIKDEKSGKEIKVHSVADDLQIYSSALYKELNPQITDKHLDSILGIRNTIFVTQLTPSERSEIVEECIELLDTLQGVTDGV
jgi:hypothetical protein